MTHDLSESHDASPAPRPPADYDRVLERRSVKANQRPFFRRWAGKYLEHCGSPGADPVDEFNQAPFVRNLASGGAHHRLFPAPELTETAPQTLRRSHLHTTAFQRAMRTIIRAAKIEKRATPHTLRHSFATHLLEAGYDIRQVQQLPGHADVRATMIDTHVANLRTKPVVSPLDRLTEIMNRGESPSDTGGEAARD